jgi:hypothetical protein
MLEESSQISDKLHETEPYILLTKTIIPTTKALLIQLLLLLLNAFGNEISSNISESNRDILNIKRRKIYNEVALF